MPNLRTQVKCEPTNCQPKNRSCAFGIRVIPGARKPLPRSDPQGCGKCPLASGTPTDRPTGMWEVSAGVGNADGPAYRPSMAIAGRKIAPALSAFAQSLALRNRSCVSDPQGRGKCPLASGTPTDRPTGTWEVSAGVGNAGGPACRPSMAISKRPAQGRPFARRRRKMIRTCSATSPAPTSAIGLDRPVSRTRNCPARSGCRRISRSLDRRPHSWRASGCTGSSDCRSAPTSC